MILHSTVCRKKWFKFKMCFNTYTHTHTYNSSASFICVFLTNQIATAGRFFFNESSLNTSTVLINAALNHCWKGANQYLCMFETFVCILHYSYMFKTCLELVSDNLICFYFGERCKIVGSCCRNSTYSSTCII